MNFINKDISRASIDLINTSWDLHLADASINLASAEIILYISFYTDEMYKIIMNTSQEIGNKHFLPKKSPRKHQILRDRRAMMRKRSKLQKKIQKATNRQTKENLLNQIEEIENN